MVQNILGEGIDVHLLGLREMAKELGEPVPELFTDDTYRVANHFSLSTSQVRGPAIIYRNAKLVGLALAQLPRAVKKNESVLSVAYTILSS